LLAAPSSEGKAVRLRATSVKRGASSACSISEATLKNSFKKRLTAELTWAKTEYAQLWVKEARF